MLGLQYWMVPIVSALVWLAMLLALFLTWVTDGKPHYDTMDAAQTIPYISDIGALELKPLFITMSAVTVITFDLSFLVEIWLRHRGRLAANTSRGQVVLSACASVAAVIGAAGLILLAVFDTKRHEQLHNIFLAVFIGGYVIAAIFICAEYQRLGIHYREFRILRSSFWIKLFFILVSVALAIAFGVCQRTEQYNVAAVVEWVIALVYSAFVASFALDFLPALKSKQARDPESSPEMSSNEGPLADARPAPAGGRYYGNFFNGRPWRH